MGKRIDRKWRFPAGAAVVLAALFLILPLHRQEAEYTVIQAVIAELPDYQKEIESRGYQVSVLPKLTQAPDHRGWMRYYEASAGPVLILTAQDGGMYCFYHGFDQYISERTSPQRMMLFPATQYGEKEYKTVLKTVRLQLCKRKIKQAPLLENTAREDSKGRYDVSVRMEITAEALESGDARSVYGGGFFETNYCSNNFEECRWWGGIDPASANRYSDNTIKQEYSAAQLLGYYKQGLALQDWLTELYHARHGKPTDIK